MPESARTVVYLVIDANVAQSAMDPSHAPAALLAADVLKAVMANQRLGLAMSPALSHEWRQWASRYAMRWLYQMVSRTQAVPESVHEHADLRSAAGSLRQNDRMPLLKDLHLVELALCTDQRIISSEKLARTKCALLAAPVPALLALHWVGPEDLEIVAWLNDDAPDKSAYLITTPARW